MLSPQATTGHKNPQKLPAPASTSSLQKVGEFSSEKQYRRNVSSANNSNNPTGASASTSSAVKRTSSAAASAASNKRPSSNHNVKNSQEASNIRRPTPEIEMYATLIDAVTTAFQNRAPSLILPQNVSSKIDFSQGSGAKNGNNNNNISTNATSFLNLVSLDSTMQNFACLAKEALEAFASLELSTAASNTTNNMNNNNNKPTTKLSSAENNTGSYSTGVVAALGELAAVVANRSESVLEIMKQLLKLFSTPPPPPISNSKISSSSSSTSSSSNLSLQYFSLLPPPFKKSVTTALTQGIDAVNEVRLSAQAIHDVRKAIVSRDLESAQQLLLQATANLNEGLDGKPQPITAASASATFLPSLLLRWLRRHWIPAMKSWAEIVKRFDEESARILKQNQLRLQSDEDTLAILAELVKKYRQEIIKKKAIELQAITMPGQGLEQLVSEAIEQPLAKNLENLKKRAKILKVFQEGIESLNLVALSQSVRDWKKDILENKNNSNASVDENNSLYLEAKKTIERLQSLGRITAGLSMVSSSTTSSSHSQENNNKKSGKTSSSAAASGVLRDAIYALNQAGLVVYNEKWFASEAQCSMSISFCEKLLRCSSEKEIERELMANANVLVAAEGKNNANNNNKSTSILSQNHHVVDKVRLLNLLVVQVESSTKKNPDAAKFWPIELSQLYTKVATEHVVQRIQRRYLVEAITSLANKISLPTSENNNNNNNNNQNEIYISEARSLLDTVFLQGDNSNHHTAAMLISPTKSKVSEASTGNSSPDSSTKQKKLHDAISRLQQAVAENSARTVKVHYESNLRLVRLSDSYSFPKSMSDIMTSLEIDGAIINERGPIRVRVADEDGDFITVVSQKEWDLVLKEYIFFLSASTSNSAGTDLDNNNSNNNSQKKKLELYLDHFRSTQTQQQQNNQGGLMMKSPAAAVPGNSPAPNPQLQVTPTPPPPPTTPSNNNNNKRDPTSPTVSRNVFTTSNAVTNQKTSGAAIRQQQLFLGPTTSNNNNNNNRPPSSNGLTPVKGKDAKNQISSLAIEGKSPSAGFAVDNNNNLTYLSPPGGRPPHPDIYPSRILQHQIQHNSENHNLLAEKLQGARNQKILSEQQKGKIGTKNNQNDDDDTEKVENVAAAAAAGFWNKPPQEFDLMTVASAASHQTAKTDLESLMMMKALAQKKWGGNNNIKDNNNNKNQKNKFAPHSSGDDDEGFDLRTVMSEATNGFHLEDHLDLLMGQTNINKKNNDVAVPNVASRQPQVINNNTHARIFGGGANVSPFLNHQYNNRKPVVKAKVAEGAGKDDSDSMSRMMIQGSKASHTPR